MTRPLSIRKPIYQPAVGPIGDVGRIFRRLGGMSRLDVVFSMLSVACIAVWACLMTGRRKAVRVSMRPAVYLLTYIPTEKRTEAA